MGKLCCICYLSFVVHWDLDQDHGITRVSQLNVLLQRLPLVTLLGSSTEQLHQANHKPHVHPLHQHHNRHAQAHKHCNSQQWHHHWLLHLAPNQTHLGRNVIPRPFKRFHLKKTNTKTSKPHEMDFRKSTIFCKAAAYFLMGSCYMCFASRSRIKEAEKINLVSSSSLDL